MFTDFFDAVSGSRHWVAAGWTMLHFVWVGLAILIVTGVARRVLYRAPADIRHLMVLVCFAALAAAPVVIYRYVLEPARVASPPQTPNLAFVTRGGGEMTPVSKAELEIAPAMESRRPFLSQIQPWLDRAARWMPLAWAAGVPFTLALLATGVVGAHRLRNIGEELDDPDLQRRFERLCESLGLNRRVVLALCDEISAPLLVGILKPVILIPPSVLAGLSPQQLELILIHELAHVRRWDNLVNLLQRLVEGVLFFHPAVWVVSRWLRLEREHCCDAVVLRHTSQPREYVETLASLALPGVAPRLAASAMAANHQLVSRIRRILNLEDRTMSLSRKTLGTGAGIIAAGLLAGLSAVLAADGKEPRAGDPTAAAAAGKPPGEQFEVIGGLEDRLLPQSFTPYSAGRVDFFDPAGAGAPYVGAGDALVRSYALQALQAEPGAAAAAADPLQPQPGADGVLQHRAAANRNWGPEQATGAPDVPRAADDARAWASLTEDGQDEWLELTYAPVEAGAVLIYETYNPGAVSEVVVTDDQGTKHRVFQGQDPSAGSDKAVLVVSLAKPIKIASVRIEIASRRTPGWNEIDAVGLLHAKGGDVSWADAARASSTYAEPQNRNNNPNDNNFIPRQHVNAVWGQMLNERGFMPASGLAGNGRTTSALNPLNAGVGLSGRKAPAARNGLTNVTALGGGAAATDPNVDNLRAENEELKRLVAEQRDRQLQQEKMLEELQKAVQDLRRGNAAGEPASGNKPQAK